ncbi:hypothetical protein DM860_001489 [Cuscuta australis]|uniref:Non-haem dioxygenase N-terminal domain-containing protein n=1 Tax=Cuscuta australis TaxID=267555 RepID=A0A328ED28_9ASTE|nr:hypothetical protein DM860_001489 [Cuscuta australis]
MLLKASYIFPDVACFSAQPASSRSLQDARNWSPISRKGFSRSIMKCTYQQPGSLTCNASNKGSFRWAKDATCPSMTSKHILPDEKRPMLADVSGCCIPVIDMDAPSNVVIQSIASACEEYGFFHVINHKIPQELCHSMLEAVLDLFHLPPEEKSLLYSDDLNRDVRICHHFRKHQTSAEKIPMWSEVFKHSWHPHDDFTQALPMNPPQYRAITNNSKSRVSLAMFYGPSKDTIIGPIEDLVDDNHPRKYRSYRFSEFIDEFRRQAGNNRIIKEAFEKFPDLMNC